MAAKYTDPIVDKLIEKLDASGPVELRKKYFKGDVWIPPQSQLPICSIAKSGLVVTPASNTQDNHEMELVLNVIWKYTRELNSSFNLTSASNALYEVVEGRNADYTLKSDTILAILRDNQRLDDNLFLAVGRSQRIQVEYGLGIERRGRNIFSVEAVVRVNARAIINRVSS